MQRWNGWGETNRSYHLPLAARTYLEGSMLFLHPAFQITL
jgi:hypothetical protein